MFKYIAIFPFIKFDFIEFNFKIKINKPVPVISGVDRCICSIVRVTVDRNSSQPCCLKTHSIFFKVSFHELNRVKTSSETINWNHVPINGLFTKCTLILVAQSNCLPVVNEECS